MENTNSFFRSLAWGGADCVDLAARFGTPLYVLDEDIIRARCAEIREDFLKRWPNTSAYYASKAFLTRAMARVIDQEGLGLDVVSPGELHTALSAGFPPERIVLHGNAKGEAELTKALSVGVGRIIVDGLMELELLTELTARMRVRAAILLRVAPGVNPHTHAFIATGHTGSKFGIPLEAPACGASQENPFGGPESLSRAVRLAMACESLDLRGLHFHIGSQLFEPDSYVQSVARVAEVLARLKDELGFEARELNVGGGPGARAHPSEPHVPMALFTDAIMKELEAQCTALKLARPAVCVEPGRWIVSEAGITLYRVETVKELPGVTYVAVDGGMADNPRHPLYDALYEAVAVEAPDAPPADWGGRVCVAGRCCESGDVLIEDARSLPRVGRGDLLALFNTGAYTFSMASNYNHLGRPAVVLVGKGHPPELIVERQTFEDLLRGDVIPSRLGAPD